ncbi:MAG: hypothetical protein V4792_10015 [Pseudomonadota bacterium]
MFDDLAEYYDATQAARGGKSGGLPAGWSASPNAGLRQSGAYTPGQPNSAGVGSNDLFSQLGFTGSPISQVGSGDNMELGTSQELAEFLKSKGYTIGQRAYNGSGTVDEVQAFDSAGKPVGKSITHDGGSDLPFLLMALAAGGITGANILGAGAAGGGAAGSAADLGSFTGIPAGEGVGAAGGLDLGAFSGIPAGGGSAGLDLGAFSGIPGGEGLAGGAAAGGGGLGAGGVGGVGGVGAGGGAAAGGVAAAGAGGGGGFASTLSGLGTKLGSFLGSSQGLGALASLGGGLLQANAAGDALDAQTAATDKANALQKYIFDTLRSDNAPLLATRNKALTGLDGLLQNPGSIVNDPGYKFGLDQGVQALDRSAASRGGLYSGATIKAGQRYGNDYAQTKLNDSFNRLTTTAGLGSTATASNTSAGNNYGNQVGNNITSLGDAAGMNSLYQGNVWGNLLSGAASAYKNWDTLGG